jgi:hypothetical protein
LTNALRYRGVSRVGVLIGLACFLALGSVMWVVLAQQKIVRGNLTDARRLSAIHSAWVTFSAEFGGVYPTPGLIDRLPFKGQKVPGRGPEDVQANTTANLYSVCILNNYIASELCVSPTDRNPNVRALMHWDAQIKADLATGSNTSYAHMPIAGNRKMREWKATANSKWPILGNRGPKDGKPSPSSFTCGPSSDWSGVVMFNDGHYQMYRLPSITKQEQAFIEDLFSTGDSLGADAILTFTKEIDEQGPVFQWD